MTTFAICITVAIASICNLAAVLVWAVFKSVKSEPTTMRYDLDDCVSKRPEDDDEAKWHAEYDKWVREEKARPYNWQEGGL